MSFIIAPSILSADFARLADEICAIEKAKADWIHVDVMDGHFVDNITIGAPVVRSIRPISKLILDVHLMIENPNKYIPDFIEAGADYITIHIEASTDPVADLRQIRAGGVKAGISLRPATKIDAILPLLKEVDLVLVMTVNPGFGGQSFLSDQVEKMNILRSEREKQNLDFLIEVDGGVNGETGKLCQSADVLVAGSYIFSRDYREAIEKLKGLKKCN